MLNASYLRTPTYPSIIRYEFTDDLFDFTAVLLDEVEWKDSNCDHLLSFDNDTLVHFGERTLADKIGISVLILAVLQNLGHLIGRSA